MLLEVILNHVWFTCVLTWVAAFSASLWAEDACLPKNVPYVGLGRFSILRGFTRYISLFKAKEYLSQAYSKYNKAGKACIMPGLWGSSILLPTSFMTWLASQGDTTLSGGSAQGDTFELPHTFLQTQILTRPLHTKIMQRHLNVYLSKSYESIHEEINLATDEYLGRDAMQHQDVDLHNLMNRVIYRAICRMCGGTQLCRNQEFLEVSRRFSEHVGISVFLLKMIPKSWRRVAGPMFTLRVRNLYARCAQHVLPLFTESMSLWHSNENRLPQNYAAWSVKEVMTESEDDLERTSDMLCRRLMSIVFAGSHNTISSAEHLLLDILSAPQERQCLETLRNEAERLDQSFGSTWNEPRMSKMVILDSTLRESLRLRTPSSRTVLRKVVAREGVKLPDNTTISQGNTLAICSWGITHDESIYPDADNFVYDRFVQYQNTGEEGHVEAKSLRQASQVEPSYLVWGFGRHTCPGRFFALAMIKMIVSHMLIHYDIQPLAKRPQDMWVDHSPRPMRNVTIRVRRRHGH